MSHRLTVNFPDGAYVSIGGVTDQQATEIQDLLRKFKPEMVSYLPLTDPDGQTTYVNLNNAASINISEEQDPDVAEGVAYDANTNKKVEAPSK